MTWWQLARRFWWAVPLLALAGGLLATRARLADARQTLAAERAAWSDEIAAAEKRQLAAEARYQRQSATAADGYAARLAAQQPVIVRSTNTVREYAQTDAGRALCLGSERVLGLDALDAELASDPAPAGGGADAVPDAGGAPPG